MIRLAALAGSLVVLLFVALIATTVPGCTPNLGGGGDDDDATDEPTCEPDAFEANDVASDAALLDTFKSDSDERTRNDATICEGDEDWYVATVPRNWVNHYELRSADDETLVFGLYDEAGVLLETAEVGDDGAILLTVDNFDECPPDEEDRDEDEARGDTTLTRFLHLAGVDATVTADYELHAGTQYVCGWE